jgi:ABC-type transporter Mla maintaining outer membrane lipid asymmetry permease subunit MlaE
VLEADFRPLHLALVASPRSCQVSSELVGCYYGYTASGGPVGVGTATAKSMVLNTVMVHLVGMTGTALFWGKDPRSPVGG